MPLTALLLNQALGKEIAQCSGAGTQQRKGKRGRGDLCQVSRQASVRLAKRSQSPEQSGQRAKPGAVAGRMAYAPRLRRVLRRIKGR